MHLWQKIALVLTLITLAVVSFALTEYIVQKEQNNTTSSGNNFSQFPNPNNGGGNSANNPWYDPEP